MEDKLKNNTNLRELVELAKGGDHSAFTELHKTYVEAIYRFVFMSLNDKDKAEDITQEVFIKAWGLFQTTLKRGDHFQLGSIEWQKTRSLIYQEKRKMFRSIICKKQNIRNHGKTALQLLFKKKK